MREYTPEWDVTLKRLPRKPLPHFTRLLIPGLAAGSGAMLAFALPPLIEASGFIDYAKCLVIGITATLTAYGVGRLGIEKGAAQAAVGMTGAAILGPVSILFVGASLFSATYAGFTVGATDRLRLEEYGRLQAEYVEALDSAGRELIRLSPALDAVVNDLSEKEACERQASCVSGHGSGGAGPVFRALSNEHQRARSVADQVKAGTAELDATLERLGELQSAYQDAASEGGLTAKERRLRAQAIVAEIGQAAGTLKGSAVVPLAKGFAGELAREITVAGRPEASAAVNRLRASHAGQLEAVLASISEDYAARPAFPSETGVADTFSFLRHFLPIAMIVAAVECVFPITLWLCTYFALLARLETEEVQSAAAQPKLEETGPAPARRRRTREQRNA